MGKKVLGRGLESLISGIEQREIRNIPLNKIKQNPFQPRKTFPENELKDLADSIKENGIIQPIIVRRKGKEYELIAGERRLRASKIAGLKEIPAIIKDINDEKMLQIAIVENIQREDLNAIDEANGYKTLIDRFKLKHEQIGVMVGKSRSHISNMLRILELESIIKKYIVQGQLSLGHAKVLLSIKNRSERERLAKDIVKKGLSVRELEGVAKKGTKASLVLKKKKSKAASIVNIEELLTRKLNRQAIVKYKKGKGKIVLSFYNVNDFNDLLKILGIKHID